MSVMRLTAPSAKTVGAMAAARGPGRSASRASATPRLSATYIRSARPDAGDVRRRRGVARVRGAVHVLERAQDVVVGVLGGGAAARDHGLPVEHRRDLVAAEAVVLVEGHEED